SRAGSNGENCVRARDWDGQTTDSDEVLMARLQGKDIFALQLLYLRYAKIFYVICIRILRDHAEAQDVVHEVFLSLWWKCRSFDPTRGKARTWLIGVTYSKCFDWRDYLRARHGWGWAAGEGAGRDASQQIGRVPNPAYSFLWTNSMVAAF